MQIITSFVYNYTSTQIEDKVIGKYLPQNHLNSEPINTSTNEDKKYLKKKRTTALQRGAKSKNFPLSRPLRLPKKRSFENKIQ